MRSCNWSDGRIPNSLSRIRRQRSNCRRASQTLPSSRWTRMTRRWALSRNCSICKARVANSRAAAGRPKPISWSATISNTWSCSCRARSRSIRTQSSYQPGSRSPHCRSGARSKVATELGRSMIWKASAVQFLTSTSMFSARDSWPLAVFSTPRPGSRNRHNVVRSRALARSSDMSGHNAHHTSSRLTALRNVTNAMSRWACGGRVTCCSSSYRTNPSKRKSLMSLLRNRAQNALHVMRARRAAT